MEKGFNDREVKRKLKKKDKPSKKDREAIKQLRKFKRNNQ